MSHFEAKVDSEKTTGRISTNLSINDIFNIARTIIGALF